MFKEETGKLDVSKIEEGQASSSGKEVGSFEIAKSLYKKTIGAKKYYNTE